MTEAAQELAVELADSLVGLIADAFEQGGPTPLHDALGRWHELWPWQARRPVERELAETVYLIVQKSALDLRSVQLAPARRV